MPFHSLARFVRAVCFAIIGVSLHADPLTKQLEIDFGRDVASRNLKGLAARSDGRLLPGPVFTDLTGPKIGDILWSIAPLPADHSSARPAKDAKASAASPRFVIGTGPEGKVQEITFNPADATYTVREIADLEETHAMALLPLPDGSLLAGTSPTAALYHIRDGKISARVPLPADSVFDLLPLPDGLVLVATGNPGKVYRVDLGKLADAGVIEGKAENDSLLAGRGVTLFGEIRDRNVRRIARLADGRIIAGSSPRGNIYSFPAAGGAPLFLQENRDAEVVDLLPDAEGGFYAALVFTPGDVFRLAVKPPEPAKEDARPPEREAPKPAAFAGRSTVVRFPADGFPETIMGKANVSFHRLARHGDWLLLTAGEQGDTFGYDPTARRSLTFAGSSSAQLNGLAPLSDGRYLLLRNNAPGLAVLAFDGAAARNLETKRLDLGQAGDLGALRFPGLRHLDPAAIRIEVSTNFGNDEVEGWSPWTALAPRDGGYATDGLRGRFVRYRLELPATAKDFQLGKPTQYHRPQNRRPSLTDFRIFPPNQGIVPAAEPPPNLVSTLGQLLVPGSRDTKDDSSPTQRRALLNSQIVPQRGVQLVYWSVNDPDGDSLAYSFAVRPEAENSSWTELAAGIADSFTQFDTGGMAEGKYVTRLTVTELAPRPAAQRITHTIETDSLLIDRTPPAITGSELMRRNGQLEAVITGRDSLSLLEGVEFTLNNGIREVVMHPVDGVLDEHEEGFRLELPEARAVGATSIEAILYDQAGNASSVRIPVK